MGSNSFVRSGSESEIFNRFEKVHIRMEAFSKAYSFGLEDLFACEQGSRIKTMLSESRSTDKRSLNMLRVGLNELFGSVCFLSLGCF